jgi:thioredoxin
MKKIIFTLFALLTLTAASAHTEEHHVISLNKKDFIEKVWNYEKGVEKWVYLGDKPCLIDFYTTWCGPCKRLAPIMEELAKEYDGQIYIYKIDTEREPEIARLFGISSIPTLLFCPKEGIPTINKGFLPKETLVRAINEIMLVKTPIATK